MTSVARNGQLRPARGAPDTLRRPGCQRRRGGGGGGGVCEPAGPPWKPPRVAAMEPLRRLLLLSLGALMVLLSPRPGVSEARPG